MRHTVFKEVSIHARVKRATVVDSQRVCKRFSFNPRPREAGDQWTEYLPAASQCFNPRPREAGDLLIPLPCCRTVIVSIHARVKRATPKSLCYNGTRTSFNPRPREAGDTVPAGVACEITVSIHARVKRATSRCFPRKRAGRCFNPRPREAGDPRSRCCSLSYSFQSTPA